VASFLQDTVDFAGSDPALTPEELRQAGDALQIPLAFGAITVSYNVPGVEKGLKLDGATVADIFLGKVTKWNDPAIAGLNDGLDLPDTDITVCHRSDESGTTKGFTTFLSAYSKTWESKVGADKTVKWPTGTGAKGNDGVAGCVKQTDGAIGYVEQAYALQNNFTTAAIKNKDGAFVEPTLEATSAAGEGASPPADLRFTTINAPGATTYPITAVTFLLVYQDMCKAVMSKDNAARVKAWLDYALGDGQQVAPELEYAPLPDPIKKSAQQKVDGLQCNGSAIATS
jgi:phosphate transport system substrate-binding protein